MPICKKQKIQKNTKYKQLLADTPYAKTCVGVAHRLNTVYVNSLRADTNFNEFEKVFNQCHNIIYHSNVRYKLFKFLEKEAGLEKELISTSEIRWISIKSAVKNFEELYTVVVKTLDIIDTEKSKELKNKILDSSFVFYLNWSLALIEVLNGPYLAFQSDTFMANELKDHLLSLKIQVCVFFCFFFVCLYCSVF